MNKQINILILIACTCMVTLPYLFTIDQVGVCFLGIKWPMHCLLDSLFGVKCALCGMTRAFTSISHGRILESFRYHHMGPLLFSYFLLQIPYRAYLISRHPLRPKYKIKKLHFYFSFAMLAAIIVNWLIYLGGIIL